MRIWCIDVTADNSYVLGVNSLKLLNNLKPSIAMSRCTPHCPVIPRAALFAAMTTDRQTDRLLPSFMNRWWDMSCKFYRAYCMCYEAITESFFKVQGVLCLLRDQINCHSYQSPTENHLNAICIAYPKIGWRKTRQKMASRGDLSECGTRKIFRLVCRLSKSHFSILSA